jgi:enterochelin esterase-like enzyme
MITMMRKTLSISVLVFFFSWLGQASIAQVSVPLPGSKVLEDLNMPSKILGKPVNFTVYLPEDYDTSTRRYPVVYLLHGYSDNETGWVQFGEVQEAADRAIANREIPPMIIVMPDGGVTWYINNHDGTVRWEDMFINEFIPFIDKEFRTRPKKEFRGISGLSMGGYGSLILSMHHPDLFAACAAFSAAVWTDEEVKAMPVNTRGGLFEDIFGTTSDKTLLTDHYKANSVMHIVGTRPKADLEKVRLYLDCGDDDFLYKGNSSLHILLRDRQVRHEFRMRDGGHTWSYWRTGITDGLRFIGESFHR